MPLFKMSPTKNVSYQKCQKNGWQKGRQNGVGRQNSRKEKMQF
jgi:hypothetical protein